VSRLRSHLERSIGSLLLLETFQILFTTLALAFVYRGQVLPPYGFFPTQLYDFLAKLRWIGGDWLGWLPPLPDTFRPTGLLHHLGVVAALLPAGIAMAVVVGAAGGLVGFAVGGRRRLLSVRSYLWLWVVVALVVHAAMAIPPLTLEDHPAFAQLLYRMRSFIIDGLAVSMVVFVASLGASFVAARVLAVSTRLRTSATALVVAASLLLAITAAGNVAGGPERSAIPPAGSHAGERLNVVLISLDSLRADHLGCYGYDRATTPNVDALAGQGVRFANAISTSSWTLPTHLTMFTSRYQLAHGVVQDTYALSPSVPTAGEIFKANGYTTAGFVSGPYLAARYGYSRGMDVYEDLSASYDERAEARSAIVAPKVNERALDWLDTHKDDTFFLFLHYFDIHYDYIPPPPYDTLFDPHYKGTIDGRDFIERHDVNPKMDKRDLEHIIALYDGEIRFTDEHVGQVLRKIDSLGLRDKTLVILVGDHGDEFFEHHNKGHHRTLYDEVLRVPLIVRLPDGSHAGTVVDDLTSLVDLLPTMLDVTKVDGPDGMEGVSLLPLLQGGPAPRRDAIYSAFFDKRGFNLQVARRTPSSVVIQHFNRITHPKARPIEAYDLDADPGEHSNVYRARTAAAEHELDAMAAFLNRVWRVNQTLTQDATGSNRIHLDDETMKRLKSLGYVAD
jgi:arylsulfatase A-like enzyme